MRGGGGGEQGVFSVDSAMAVEMEGAEKSLKVVITSFKGWGDFSDTFS